MPNPTSEPAYQVLLLGTGSLGGHPASSARPWAAEIAMLSIWLMLQSRSLQLYGLCDRLATCPGGTPSLPNDDPTVSGNPVKKNGCKVSATILTLNSYIESLFLPFEQVTKDVNCPNLSLHQSLQNRPARPQGTYSGHVWCVQEHTIHGFMNAHPAGGIHTRPASYTQVAAGRRFFFLRVLTLY